MTAKNLHIQRAIDILGSQSKLADACGLSQTYIGNLLLGRRNASATTAIAISRATGGRVRIADLAPEFAEAVADELTRPDPAQDNAPSQGAAA